MTLCHAEKRLATLYTVYRKRYAHVFVVLCFVVVMQSFIMNSHEVFIHIHQGCFAGTGAIVRLPQCQWSKPDGYGKISQCITPTKHSKAKTVCIFLWIYCTIAPKLPKQCYICQIMFDELGRTFNECYNILALRSKKTKQTYLYNMMCFKLQHVFRSDIVFNNNVSQIMITVIK